MRIRGGSEGAVWGGREYEDLRGAGSGWVGLQGLLGCMVSLGWSGGQGGESERGTSIHVWPHSPEKGGKPKWQGKMNK